MQAVFWISLFVLFYTYVGYGLLLFVINAIKKRKHHIDEAFFPPITLVVPAYNEEGIIQEKIGNSLKLDYPDGQLHFIFVTDGSTDRTLEIVQQYPQIKVMHSGQRRGKTAAINRAMKEVETPFVVMTDANALLDLQSLKKMVRHFSDEQIGGVSGEKRIAKNDSIVGFGERLYWQYESMLKKANANFFTLVGAAGELFAIRTRLFEPVDEKMILDDFVISAKICQKGYRFLYESEAYAVENASASISAERKRKIRISAGCFQALASMKSLLNPFKNPVLSFQYFSHRVLRWAVCPVLLPVSLFANIYLFLSGAGTIYSLFFWMQVVCYLLAFLGWLVPMKKALAKPLLVPSYFLFMVLSQYAGFYRFVTKKQTVLWEKLRREPLR
ncbi:MAG: glycosyltransferase family 2 protein [Chitinophagaceae bacterium]|nr:MAG: glycosyltransferase family 2 protein [Chitinophagaceae bacterium]